MSTAPPPAPPPNTSFGHYTLVDRLAVGGMAEVFRALEPRPVGEPRLVVIKRMLPSIAARRGARDTFKAEADLSAVVRHENVVEVLGFGDEQGQPYLALEYVRGLDLWRLTRFLTRTGTAISVDLAVYVVRSLLAGLHAVHEASDADGNPLGVVHRDVSPSNLLLSVHGDVKLADFGIAFATVREHLQNVAPLNDKAKGKLGYLAPEQVLGIECDRRADLFSAGVIAAELLMGRPLFAGGSELAVLLAIRDANLHPFHEIASTLPDGLAEVVVEALAKDPDARMASAAEMWARLGPYVTRPASALKDELAVLVTDAMAQLDELPAEATPLDEGHLGTHRSSPDGATPVRPSQQLTPPRPEAPDVEVDLSELGDDVPTAERVIPSERPTLDLDTVTYRVRTTEGRELGPWPYAKLVEALTLGKLGPADEVSDPGGGFRRIAEVASLRRHLPPSTQRRTPSGRHASAPQDADETAPLGDGGIIGALAWSAVRRTTGLWLCESGGVRKEIYVKHGVPEFVTSNLAGELLGEYLVSKDVITRGELDMALAVMPRFEGRLGDTLAALGLVEPVHLFQHIAGQVRDKLLDLFTWTAGEAALYKGIDPPSSGFPLGIEPWQIVDEGIRRRLAEGLEDERFAEITARGLAVAPDLSDEVASAALPTDVRLLLTALDRPQTFQDLTEVFHDEAHKRDGRARRAIVVLMHLGAAVLAG